MEEYDQNVLETSVVCLFVCFGSAALDGRNEKSKLLGFRKRRLLTLMRSYSPTLLATS